MRKTRIAPRGDAVDQRKAQRIRAEFLDDDERIDAVAQRLAHLAPLRVADDAVNQHVFEGNALHVLQPGKNHAGDPEKDDVVSGDEDVRRIKIVEVGRLFGESQRRERPERGRKPGIQHVFVLVNMRAAAVLADGDVLLFHHDRPAVFAVECGNAVPPPKLTGNAPIPDILHPVEVDFGKTRGRKGDGLFAHLFDRGLCQRFHLDEPLLGDGRFHRVMAAIAMPDVVF